MAVRTPSIYFDAFAGDKTAEQCNRIDDFLDFVENGGKSVPELSKFIYNLPNDSVRQVIEQKSNKGIKLVAGELRDYQTLGVMFMILTRNCILSDSVGLGKTAQVAGLLNFVKSEKLRTKSDNVRYIFLTEKTLIHQTREEFVRFTGDYIHVTTGETDVVNKMIAEIESQGDFRGIVGSYSLASNFTFVRWLHHYAKTHEIDYLIVDESDALSNKNLNYKTFSSVRDIARNRIEMNATPFGRDIYSFYNQLDFACPEAMPFKTTFDKMFVSKHHITGEIIGYKDPELFKRAVRYMVFGQTRQELGVSVKNSNCHLLLYRPSEFQRDLLRKTTSYEYVFEYPSWLSKDLKFDNDDIPKMWLSEILATRMSSEEQMMVYCKYIDPMYELESLFAERGIPAMVINGEVSSSAERKKLVAEFESGEYQILITNVKRGLNLGFVNHIVLFSFTHDSGVLSQIEGRAVRERDIRNKNIYILACNSKEIDRVFKARGHLTDVRKHTKEETSLLFNFLIDALPEANMLAEEALKDNSEREFVQVVYSMSNNGYELEVLD